MNDEVWVLGATGRTGRAVGTLLHKKGIPLVLVGRDRARLNNFVTELGGAPRILEGSLDSAFARLAADTPAVVVNTVGPFTATSLKVAQACPPGTHYVDVANELVAVENILKLDRQAAKTNQVLVTGAGFGVMATESVVLRLCKDQPRPARVRVDALASVASEPGVLGAALVASIVEVLAFGGREVRQGRLVRSRVAGHYARLTTPNGENLAAGSGPSGELIAAWHASKAESVISASSFVPSNAFLRFILPAFLPILRLSFIRRLAVNRGARVPLHAQERPRPYSWGHARAEWSDGRVREGWLQAGDGMDFTAAVAAEVTLRLLKGESRAGSYTPGALFGPDLAEAAGGKFIINQS
ncbi:MAG TPA: hypothetical protein VH186_20335 [Chloroflexia bacterium]|nr:hypothetical protein [Chloroflexia bacterium]